MYRLWGPWGVVTGYKESLRDRLTTPFSAPALSPALNLASQTLASQCFQLSGLFTPQTM